MSQPGNQKIERLNELLLSLLGSKELADRWWHTPNKAFDMQTPAQADIVLVSDYLIWHCFCAGG